MSNRRGRRPPFEDQDEGPTAQNYVGPPSRLHPAGDDDTDGILTEEDIDAVPTAPQHAPVPPRGGRLPRFEGTGSLTLPRGFLASPTPVVLPNVAPRLPPPTPFRVLPPPPRFNLEPAEDDGESSFSLAPTPIRQLPSVPPPKPPPRRSSRPPPRSPSRPPDRPRAPLASAPPPGEATRPFALNAPRPPQPSAPSEPDIEIDPRLAVPEAPPFPPAYAPTPAPSEARSSPRHPSIPPPARPSAPPPGPLSSPPPARPSAPPGPHYSTPPPARASTAPSRTPTERPPRVRLPRELPLPANPNLRAASMGVLVALIAGALIMMLVMVIRSRQLDEQTEGPVLRARPLGHVEPTRVAPVAPTSETSPAFAGCSLARTVERLSSSAMPNVVPIGGRAPGLNRVALGYASARNHAEGIIVDLDDLSVESRYSEELPRPVSRVTPLADRSPVAFAVDYDVPNVQAARTIAASPPLRVGVTYFGFVRIADTGDTTVIWPGGRYDGIGEPAFVTTERDGYGVAFRSGRTSGDVFAGWLTPSGTADGDLIRIDAGAREVGAPAIGANDRNVVVVFPARAPGEPWRLRIATAKRAKIPRASREIDTGSGSADAVSPSIAALPNGGWLLQWIEGSAGARRVVVRALDADLSPVGLPLEIASGVGIQDAAGTLVPRAGRVLAVHLSATERSVGLWGAVLRCG